ncbi:hypothetical protein BgiMline_010220 [Biomphalaria glabrata]|nr:hypothetical protein BgiMline_023955 [Biomphalaria glabrata]
MQCAKVARKVTLQPLAQVKSITCLTSHVCFAWHQLNVLQSSPETCMQSGSRHIKSSIKARGLESSRGPSSARKRNINGKVLDRYGRKGGRS